MRRISYPIKKLRGVKRRLRALEKWSAGFDGAFPADIAEERYYNFKIPVLRSLVEGKWTTPAIQAECAQRLIDACRRLMSSKPAAAAPYHVVATVCIPDMFTSEVCIYTDEGYFRGHTQPSSDKFGSTTLITDRSLAKEWSLDLPAGMNERGVLLRYEGYEDNDDWYVSEHWFFGELA